MPESKMTVPAQPDKDRYSISELYLVPVYNDRASYEAAFGEQAPPFNPNFPVQKFFVYPIDTDPFVYFGYQNGEIRKMSIPAEAATNVNLPGSYRYPTETPWFGEESTAYVLEFGRKTFLVGTSLVDKGYAEGVLAEMQRDLPGVDITLSEVKAQRPIVIVYPASEPRRRMAFYINGVQRDAALILSNRFSVGIGRPGKWSLVLGEPIFTPDPEPVVSPNAVETPIPVRPLLPNEKLEFNPFSGVMVVKTDTTTEEPNVGDSALLQQVAKDLKAIMKFLDMPEE